MPNIIYMKKIRLHEKLPITIVKLWDRIKNHFKHSFFSYEKQSLKTEYLILYRSCAIFCQTILQHSNV